MASHTEIALRLVEATAILLPLMGIFMQVFIREYVRGESGLDEIWINRLYVTISFTSMFVVLAGAGSAMTVLLAGTSLSLAIALIFLYLGYLGIAITIVAIGGFSLDVTDPVEQAFLSHWNPDDK